MTVGDAFDYYVKSLSSLYEKNEAEHIAFWVFGDTLKINRASFRIHDNADVSELKANQLAYILLRLLKGEPVQYVLGYSWFFGLRLKVDASVLIPRPETEELVEWIVKDGNLNRSAGVKILDVGTGSGCIAIALKKNFPNANVVAIDISEKALKIARENAVACGTEINFIRYDILSESSALPLPTFEIIVSNPPYISNSEKKAMHKNVLDFEPREALFVQDDDPLIFYRYICHFTRHHLSPYGKVFLEINEKYAMEVEKLLLNENFKTILKKDMNGKFRMVCAALSFNA